MGLRVLISAATERELSGLEKNKIKGVEVELLLTGVGPVATTWNLMKRFSGLPLPDLVINTGIAGSFNSSYPVGSVVIAGSDCFGDLGIEKDGRFISLFDAGFEDPDKHPFNDGRLYASNDLLKAAGDKWPVVKGVTVSTSSGTLDSIQRLMAKFEPEIETMEVAAFYYTCTRVGIPSIAIRSISNMVLPGDRSTWNIGLAIRELGPALSVLIERIATS